MSPEVYLVLSADKNLPTVGYACVPLYVLVYLLLWARAFHSAPLVGCCHPLLFSLMAYYLVGLYLILLLLVSVE